MGLDFLQGLSLKLSEGILLPRTLNFHPYEPASVDSQDVGKSDPLIGSSMGLEVESGELRLEQSEDFLHYLGLRFAGHED
jgi:hypothetical protein